MAKWCSQQLCLVSSPKAERTENNVPLLVLQIAHIHLLMFELISSNIPVINWFWCTELSLLLARAWCFSRRSDFKLHLDSPYHFSSLMPPTSHLDLRVAHAKEILIPLHSQTEVHLMFFSLWLLTSFTSDFSLVLSGVSSSLGSFWLSYYLSGYWRSRSSLQV